MHISTMSNVWSIYSFRYFGVVYFVSGFPLKTINSIFATNVSDLFVHFMYSLDMLQMNLDVECVHAVYTQVLISIRFLLRASTLYLSGWIDNFQLASHLACLSRSSCIFAISRKNDVRFAFIPSYLLEGRCSICYLCGCA
jgi:hypothetical protein